MCRAQHRRDYCNPLTHTPDHRPYIGLEVQFLIAALLIKTLLRDAVLIDTIIPLLSRKLSIVVEGQLYFSPPHIVIASPDLSGRSNLGGVAMARKGRWFVTTI